MFLSSGLNTKQINKEIARFRPILLYIIFFLNFLLGVKLTLKGLTQESLLVAQLCKRTSSSFNSFSVQQCGELQRLFDTDYFGEAAYLHSVSRVDEAAPDKRAVEIRPAAKSYHTYTLSRVHGKVGRRTPRTQPLS